MNVAFWERARTLTVSVLQDWCVGAVLCHPGQPSPLPVGGPEHRPSRPFQMLTDLNTYLNKAIPDTRLTIKKYLDVKFEYLVSGLRPLGRDRSRLLR